MIYFENAINFLLQSLIGFVLYIILLRFWMQWVRADFRNELGQFIIKVTNPVVIPLRKVIPSVGTLDTSTVLFAYLVCVIKIAIFLLVRAPEVLPNAFPFILLWSIGLLIKASIYLFLIAIFADVIASWVAPHSYHPILLIARTIALPITNPIRKLIPPFSGIDFSPMIASLLMIFTLRLIVDPLLPLPV